MSKLPMCRVCLAANVRMYVIVNKNLQELYERLTDNPFITTDSRPMLVCFFCCAKLKQCCQFQRKCLESEELFAKMMYENYERNPLINQDHLECYNSLIQTPMVHISVESDDIKEELPAVCEKPEDIIEPKEEHLSDEEVELENLNSIHSDVEDTAAQQSESSSEDDLPLIRQAPQEQTQLKTYCSGKNLYRPEPEELETNKKEVEEQEVSRKRKASDTQQEVKLENLISIYSDVEDTPAKQSESSSEDDLPLIRQAPQEQTQLKTYCSDKSLNRPEPEELEINKKEVEEQEVSRKRKASDTQQPRPHRNIDLDKRAQIIALHNEGNNLAKIARETGVTRKTVELWVRRFEEEGSLQDHQRSGRPQRINALQRQTMIREYEEHGFLSTNYYASLFDTSTDTVRRVLRREGLYHRRQAVKPQNRKK